MRDEDATVLHDGGGTRDLRRIYAVLRVLQGGGEVGGEYRLRPGDYTIGREPEAEICLPHDYVSRRQAKIRVTWDEEAAGYRCLLTDLSGTNPTRVNDRSAREAVLEDGDKIIVGDTVLRFELLDEIDLKFHRDLQQRIRYDGLTGLLTKETFSMALARELQLSRSASAPLTVLMMDIDYFKKVNDTYGHPTGDHVLRVLGSLLGGDAGRIDVFARYGGEEFTGYFSGMRKDRALGEAERIRRAVEGQSIDYESKALSVTVSIGLSEHPGDGVTPGELIAAADKALYRAKKEGRNRVCLA